MLTNCFNRNIFNNSINLPLFKRNNRLKEINIVHQYRFQTNSILKLSFYAVSFSKP